MGEWWPDVCPEHGLPLRFERVSRRWANLFCEAQHWVYYENPEWDMRETND